MADDDLIYSTIGELNAKLKRREVSCVELTKAYLDRLESLGPKYNALALPLRKSALRKAKYVDGDIKIERFRGPLQGIPFGAKDLLAVAGYRTTWGAKPYENQVFKEDAAIIRKLDKTGAVLIGKLAMVELAGGGGYRYPSASLTGPGLNPWDRGRWAGGSSSGSGAAVAAGMVGFALGSETSGSILTPSAYCGVTGLRPTYGLVSRAGAMALSWTMDKIGPMCRSAEDCAFVLETIAGGDSADPGTAGKNFYYFPEYVRDLKQVKIGIAPVDYDMLADPSTKSGFDAALSVLKGLGLQTVVTHLPDFPYPAMAGTIIKAEASSIFEPLVTSGKVDELADQRLAQGLKAGLELPAKEYLKAMRIRALAQEAFRQLFVDVDILVAPTRYTVASKIGDALDRPPSAASADRPKGMSGLIPAGNLAGLPALSLPCGFADGLPIGLQLVSRAFNENLLLRMGIEFQARTDWHKRRPPV
ncbi:MAG TPA: amidase [Bryobacteraceae bacterium]|jgi:aspartyl-tRNA(Asn)/glutamyl-tRNA(Gln) amidotransferase subunit A